MAFTHTHIHRCKIYTVIIVYMLCNGLYIEVYAAFSVCEYSREADNKVEGLFVRVNMNKSCKLRESSE